LHAALRELLACFPVYRTYARADDGKMREEDRHYVHEAIDRAKQYRPELDPELFDFLRIPSVSAKSEHNDDTKRAAEWVKASLDKIGVPAKIYPTAGHPIVVGEWRKAPGAPTVLIYGHYDVQPAEPLELWTSPAFEPTVRDGKLFARGSVDDKGQLFLHIKALEAHLASRGKLPVNVVVIAEGEEEVGSDHLAEFVQKEKKLLAADSVVISDSAMFAPGLPSILSSLRGLAYFEINVQGPIRIRRSQDSGEVVEARRFER
jgi:acetylornithine deacetylase/succinyl-diaminopimelate desuccinylase-like protein